MPNYNLHCTNCDTEHTIRATMTEKAENRIECPDCGSNELETVFKSPPAYVKNAGTAPQVQCPQRNSCVSCPHAG